MSDNDYDDNGNGYDKKMKYRSVAEGKKIKVERSDKRRKQSVRNALNNISVADIYEEDFDDIGNLWDED